MAEGISSERSGGRGGTGPGGSAPTTCSTAAAVAPEPEALDLGSAVLPVNLRSCWKRALAALVARS